MVRNDLFIKIHHPIIELAQEIPENDNLILMGNHPHKLDPLLINRLSPNITFVSDKKDKYDLFVKKMICNLDSQYMGDYAPLFIAILENNIMCIFPEGDINNSDELKPFHKGAMMVALRSHAKIMPFAISGSYNLFQNDRLTLKVGEAFETYNMNEQDLSQHLKEKIYELKRK